MHNQQRPKQLPTQGAAPNRTIPSHLIVIALSTAVDLEGFRAALAVPCYSSEKSPQNYRYKRQL